jgi:hypothetical protein
MTKIIFEIIYSISLSASKSMILIFLPSISMMPFSLNFDRVLIRLSDAIPATAARSALLILICLSLFFFSLSEKSRIV